jgi:protein TonB
MSKVSVFNQEWLDLVFEGRNKEYGAYKLRQQDSKTTLLALFSGIALMGVLVSIPMIANLFKEEVVVATPYPVLGGVEIVDAEHLFPKEEQPKPPQEAAAPAPRRNEPTVRHTTLVATSEPVDTDPPTTAQVTQTNAGTTTSPGTGPGIDIGNTSPNGPINSTGTGIDTEGEGDREPVIVALLDQAPQFPGGVSKFIEMVGDRFKAPEATSASVMKVYVSFVVEKDGSMSTIKVTRDPHNMGAEAIRALKSIKTKWKPGRKNGNDVRTAYTLPIVVQVKE